MKAVTLLMFPKHLFADPRDPLAKRIKGLSNPPISKDTFLRKQPKLNPSICRHIFYPREQGVRTTDSPQQRTF